MSKFKAYRKEQEMLFPSNLMDYVPASHLARVVDQVVEQLDTRNIEDKYSDRGQHTYHPKIMTKLLFYGYAVGERSGRVISRKTETDTAYMYLSQMYKPNFRTINDFRKNHLKELSEYFVAIVKYCAELNMVNIGQIHIDGTKMKANASSRRTKDQDGYAQWIKRIEEKIQKLLNEAQVVDEEEDKLYGDKRGDELPEEINTQEKLKAKLQEIAKRFKEPEQKINATDPDAPGMPKINIGYNCQAAVTNEQIIVAAEVITDTNDKQALIPVLKAVETTVDQTVTEVSADAGYASFHNYEYLSKNGMTGYIPDQDLANLKRNQLPLYHTERFAYDAGQNVYRCPQGQILSKDRRWRKDNNQYTIYKAKDCTGCHDKSLCTQQNQRTVAREDRRPLLEQMRERLNSILGQEKYQKRMFTIEPVFGHLKHNLGYRYFLLRTLEKVQGEFKIMCTAYNIKKIFQFGLLTG